jgi:hypothetical protein
MNIKKIATIALTGAILLSPVMAMADTTTSTSSAQVQLMLSQIQALQTQIQALKTAQTQVASTSATVLSTLVQMRNLKQGMTGDDVKTLQAILAADPSIYSGGITGYFGGLTSEALRKYQKKNGLDSVGFVGPKTLKKLMEHMRELGLSSENGNATSSENRKDGAKKLCVKVPPGHLIAPGWLKKEGKGDDKQKMWYKLDDNSSSILPPCNNNGNSTSTPRDITAPIISSIGTNSLLATTTNIVWTTNETSNSKVWFGTSTPVNYKADPNVRFGDLFVTNHVVPLSGLATSATYYYIVGSVDGSGNTATSSQSSFTTLAQ